MAIVIDGEPAVVIRNAERQTAAGLIAFLIDEGLIWREFEYRTYVCLVPDGPQIPRSTPLRALGVRGGSTLYLKRKSP